MRNASIQGNHATSGTVAEFWTNSTAAFSSVLDDQKNYIYKQRVDTGCSLKGSPRAMNDKDG